MSADVRSEEHRYVQLEVPRRVDIHVCANLTCTVRRCIDGTDVRGEVYSTGTAAA
jgi:hypothetical protein